MAKKPLNLIVLTSDEMRGDCPSFMGNPDCRTPYLDEFADNAVVFDNHFAVHTKCVPSRISISTGRYCHTDGYRTINLHLPPDQPDLLSTLKKRGYETAVFGHNHVWEDFWGNNKKSSGCVDYHSYTEEHFQEMLKREWPAPPAPEGAVKPLELDRLKYHYTGRITRPISGMCDHSRAEQAAHFLKEVRDRSRPFYLHVNMSTPHPGYAVEEPYYSMYDRAAIKPWPYALPENAPFALRKMRELRSELEVADNVFREIQSVYYGMVTRVDRHIGRVLETIDDEGLFENTIVLFTVDHGDFAGQYGLPEKWDTCMSDCLTHVPLILWAPQLPQGVRVDALNEHVDILPTILELLGTKPDWGVHGQSLLPMIDGKKGKEAVFADGGHEEEMFGRFNFARKTKDGKPRALDGKQRTYAEFPESMSRTKMVRTKRWKLVVRLTGGNELYDMKNDPYEMKNVWPGHEKDATLSRVVSVLQLKMIEWCLRTDTDRPFEPNVGA